MTSGLPAGELFGVASRADGLYQQWRPALSFEAASEQTAARPA